MPYAYRRDQCTWRTQPWVWNLFFFLAPLVQVFCVQSVTLHSGTAAFLWMFMHIGSLLLQYLLLLLLLLVLLSLTGSLLCSTLLPTIPLLLLSIASYFKQAANGVPLVPSDLSMLGRVGDVASFLRPGASLGAGAWLAILVSLVFFALIAVFAIKPRVFKRRWYIRIAAAALSALLLLGIHYLIPFRDYLLGEGSEVQAERNERVGLILGLYGSFLAAAADQPADVSENNMNLLLKEIQDGAGESQSATVQPHVILLMSESFCDPKTILPDVTFHEDPIPNYRALSKKWPSGNFLSNTYAGGTGNVELEVLTGVPNVFTSEGSDLTNLPDKETYERMPSIVKAFSGAGYQTEFVHSYTDRLYRRDIHLPAIGFEKILFDKDFPPTEVREGPYLSDKALTRKLITEFEGRDRSKPLFLYGLSMQNHQPYHEGKFPTPSGLDYTANGLTTAEKGALDALVYGVRGADAALADLIAYFETSDEPVMIVFWGDHLPSLSLGDGSALYSRLGYTESPDTLRWKPEMMKQMHSTPFLVWNNYEAQMPVTETQSALGLGTHILDWAGVAKPLYFHWVDQAMQDMLLYRERLFVATNGTPYADPPKQCEETVEKFKNITNDILYGKGYIAPALTKVPDP